MTEHELTELAASQYGVFSRLQAREYGLGEDAIAWRIETRRWELLHPNVYRIAGTPESWRQLLQAACLAHDGRAVVSHRSAAALWNMPGFEPAIVEVLVSHQNGCVWRAFGRATRRSFRRVIGPASTASPARRQRGHSSTLPPFLRAGGSRRPWTKPNDAV